MAWFRCMGDTSSLEATIASLRVQISDLNGQISQKDQTISNLNGQISNLQNQIPPLSPVCGIINKDIKILPFKPDFVAIYGRTNDRGTASIDDYVNNFHNAIQSYDQNRSGPSRVIDIDDHAIGSPSVGFHYAVGVNNQENVKFGVASSASITLPFSPNIVIGYWITNDYLAYSILDNVSGYNEEVYGYNGDTRNTRFSINGNTVNGFSSGITYFAARL